MHAESDLMPDIARALTGASGNGGPPPNMAPDVGQ
jgi:hypothetical protein